MLNEKQINVIEKALNESVVEVEANEMENMTLVEDSAIYSKGLSIESLNEEGYYYITKMPESVAIGYVKVVY